LVVPILARIEPQRRERCLLPGIFWLHPRLVVDRRTYTQNQTSDDPCEASAGKNSRHSCHTSHKKLLAAHHKRNLIRSHVRLIRMRRLPSQTWVLLEKVPRRVSVLRSDSSIAAFPTSFTVPGRPAASRLYPRNSSSRSLSGLRATLLSVSSSGQPTPARCTMSFVSSRTFSMIYRTSMRPATVPTISCSQWQ
jgi:hypothetical protein